MKNIKDMVTNGKKVRFTYLRANTAYYITECGFEFPVPLEDIGEATLLWEDKAIFFMRYIRKHLETIERVTINELVQRKVEESYCN